MNIFDDNILYSSGFFKETSVQISFSVYFFIKYPPHESFDTSTELLDLYCNTLLETARLSLSNVNHTKYTHQVL